MIWGLRIKRGFVKKNLLTLFLLLPLILMYIFLFKIERARVGAFGCFDDCFYYVGAYFMTKGRALYSEIFFNHQMLPAYMSYLIQIVTQPKTIYQLLLYHRVFLLLFSFVFNSVLIIRFRWVGLGFAVLYEFTKFYLFGDRFLAESFTVYPLIYMTGACFEYFEKKKILFIDAVFAGIFSWFIIFSREPYIPVALVLFGFILNSLRTKKQKIISLGIFLGLSLLTVISVPISEYWFNIVTVNLKLLGRETNINTPLEYFFHMFFYPVSVWIFGEQTIIGIFLKTLSAVFFATTFFLLKQKKIKLLVFVFIILGFANTRVVTPGKMFYEGFHLLQWYGLFIFIIFLFIDFILKKQKILAYVSLFIIGVSFGYILFSKQSYLLEKVDRHAELITNYGNYLSNGEVIKILANKNDTLFADQIDDLLYFQADIKPAYKYSWYFSAMPSLEKYKKARQEMFEKYPPDFYYGNCSGSSKSIYLEEKYAGMYIQLHFAKKPTCLYIKKTNILKISKEKWKKIKQFEYYLPSEE